LEKNLRVVSLFDGISCGRAALALAGYTVSYYAAFEIDKYAKAVSRYNYPDIVQHGDVIGADFTQFKDIHMVIGGSPCTTFSIARSNKGRETEKGGIGWALFMRFVDAVRTIKPKYWLYENVNSMSKTLRTHISEELGCEPIMINSALVSAQQRRRLYWTNIAGVTQPADRGILLQDILEPDTIFPTVKGVGAALRTRADENGSFKRLEVRDDGKLNALTTVQTDCVICTPVRIGSIGKGSQGERIYSVRGKTVSLSANGGGGGAKTGLYKIDLPDGDYYIRKLTTIEAERCQGLPDFYTAHGIDNNGNEVKISNTQRYKCLGNGWQVTTVAHIFSFM